QAVADSRFGSEGLLVIHRVSEGFSGRPFALFAVPPPCAARSIPVSALREGAGEAPDLVVHLPGILDRLGDLLAEERAIAHPHAVDCGRDGADADAEARGGLGVGTVRP